jgi:hypothetical protein
MARHSGKNAIVKNGTAVIDGLVNFDIEETISDIDLTAAGDSWQSHDTGIPGWTMSFSLKLDHDAAANQTLRAGDTITFQGYTEGDATGKTYWSGTATVLSHKQGAAFEGEATREYSCKGKGALSSATAV